jgi:hypothetical protein
MDVCNFCMDLHMDVCNFCMDLHMDLYNVCMYELMYVNMDIYVYGTCVCTYLVPRVDEPY